jgi:hypothetical protein
VECARGNAGEEGGGNRGGGGEVDLWIADPKDSGAGVEGGEEAGLGNGYGLLLHGFVDGGPHTLLQPVKVVDAANSAVCQH